MPKKKRIIIKFEEFETKFSNEIIIINYFIKTRYPNGVTCNHCGSTNVYHRTTEPKVFTCYNCYNSFSIFKGTIFEHSTTNLIKWMYVILLFLIDKTNISTCQIQRELNVTYKTAWRMVNQVASIMGNNLEEQFGELLGLNN